MKERITRRVATRYGVPAITYRASPIERSAVQSGRTASLQAGLEEAFRRLEQAIDAHDRLKRISGLKGEPEMHFTRLGGTVSILVTLQGSRKRPTKITGNGASIDEAVEDLMRGLDIWADAIA